MTKSTPEVREAASDWLSKAEFLTGEATRSYLQNNTTAYRQLLLAAFTALQRGTAATSADDTAATSDIFTASVRAEEAAEPITAATVRADAVETLSNLMTGETVSHADRADIAKYFIESYAPGTGEAKKDALKTLHDLINDEYAPDAFRAKIAKYVIESRMG